ncbi:exopolyphosphatase [Salinibacterium xinjiangense]|uniref:Exopolyphosphatase / guanosine-5'-triphosphate,3'-diphosphate pyrophosphatase n=1 Tax=Salinibacterium xinjiangense TaxID=386302 RepID=A0A2C8ZHD6_9MICO|nr:Ppx/GppA phosphatase family protein [Salinibacterium xinjiangense]GGK89602.1 exopolyphosphatase [Salinibacterium xinjiangense]SOE64135.1 exopolyphosphatase / guanosine-5'-triphosphate,3'-diphosphate pyrophosphatase [Salinibacterium xinjiangense]
MTRVAAVDCGTNSIRLLIADADGRGGLRDVVRTLRLVRLGEGVDRTGRFGAEALERTLSAVRDYAELCREHHVERIRFVATSATRDAANRAEFTDAVAAILGVPAEVIPGVEEAALSFRGALTALENVPGMQHLVVDLGGGSTELVLGGSMPDSAYSMDIGCVRLAERYVHNDPPLPSELASIRRDVDAALDIAVGTVDVSQAAEVIGVAGTVTTITALALGLDSYDPIAISGSRLPLHAVMDACDLLSRMPRAERAALPFMHPGRVDVIGAGAVIWSTVLQRVADATAAAGRPLEFVTTSEHDILDGVALSLGA